MNLWRVFGITVLAVFAGITLLIAWTARAISRADLYGKVIDAHAPRKST